MDQILKTSETQNTAKVEKMDEVAKIAKVAELLLAELEMGLLFNEVK